MHLCLKRAASLLLTTALLLACAACGGPGQIPVDLQAQGGSSPSAAPTATASPAPVSTPAPTPDPTPTPSPSPTASPTETPLPTPTPTPDPLPYYVYVEKGSATITIYGKDKEGKYTVALHSFLTAIGRSEYRTPLGKFKISTKSRWKRFSAAGESDAYLYAQYATCYRRSLYIHSSLYSSKEIDRLLPAYYNQIGKSVTAGCLRTTAYAAWWIYTYCPAGTTVEIVNGSPRGTSAETPPPVIEAGKKHRYYDPTDPEQPNFTEPAS